MLNNLESIHATIRPAVRSFFEHALSVFQHKVDSIYLYGSIVTDDFLPDQSDVNSLVLFDSFGFAEVRRFQPLMKNALPHRISAPLCLGVETFTRSADTFPLEFIEIRDKHTFLFGQTNRLACLEIPRELLRVKIEEQIKGKLIRLRQILMEHQENDRRLLYIMGDAQRQLFPVFRNLLRFVGVDDPPLEKDRILKELEDRTRLAVVPCRRIWEHVSGKSAIPVSEAIAVYGEYLDILLKLAQMIDRLENQ